jgi:hypothetical protein
MCQLSGTVSTSDGNNTVNGSGTNFSKELLVGDEVYINVASGLATYTVSSIASDTQMAVEPPTGYSNNGGFYRVTKRQLIHADKLTGNVGIGTTNPDYPLEVSGWISAKADAPSTDAVINLVASNATKLLSPDFNPPTSIARIKCIAESDSNSSSALAFYTRDSASNIGERMRITSAGSVGVGYITNPETFDSEANQLVVRAEGHAGMTICAGTTSSRSNIYFADGNEGSGAYRGGITYDHSQDDLSFRAAGTERMWLTSNTRLGLGIALPESTLHVKGSFGAPLETGSSQSNGIARFGQIMGNGVLDVGFGDPYSWLQSRHSTDYSTNYGLAINPNGGNVTVGTVGSNSQAKFHIAQSVKEPVLELQYNSSEGGFYKHLGVISEETYNNSTNYHLHIRLRTVWNDEAMGMFKIRGYLPYSNILDTDIGMYRYNNASYRAFPYGIKYKGYGTSEAPAHVINTDNTTYPIPPSAGVTNVYNSISDPGYLVICVFWPTNYTGVSVEYFGGGGGYGWKMQHDLEIIDCARTTSAARHF